MIDRLASALAGRYRVERELGAGGMATVYLAADLKHDRKVAIKVLNPDLAAALGAERFLQEIRTTAALRHPNILPLFDSGAADGFLYYVMPFVEGESLRDRLAREGRLPLDEALRIAGEVADALGYAHSRGVVHRDIKPENILLERGHAVVADFGIAKALDAAGGATLTRAGVAIGTPLYMSPEQSAGDSATDHRTDLYSWGLVVWESLAGAHPFAAAATPQALLAAHMTQVPPDVAARRPDIPTALNAIVRAALEKDPARRPASAEALVTALRQAATASGAHAASGGSRKMRAWIGVGAALLVVLAATIMAVRGRWSGPGGSSVIRSLAVLPLDNYSGDPAQDYFAEGMTDELTSDLASISQLRVTSRGSAMQFQGKNRPATPAIAKTLDVDAVVEGSVVRSGDNVRITVQLIDARADRHLWAQSFERRSSDVLALQAELARAIAGEINVRLTPQEQVRLQGKSAVDPAAHDAYLKGRYFFNRPSDDNLQKAITQFEVAVGLSPDFALAYSGLSDAYLWAGYNEGFITASEAKPKARDAALRAVALDENSAEAHASLATFKLFYEYDWDGSEREFRRAIALNPNYAFAHDQFGMLLAFVGRYDEAIAEGARAIALDPLSPQVLIDAVMAHMFKRDFAKADELVRRAAELDPAFFFPVAMPGWLYLEQGRYREAIAGFEAAAAMDAPPFVTAYLAYAHGMAGDRAGAMTALAALRKMAGGKPVLPFNLALVYLGLGEHERAIDYIEQALAADSQQIPWLGHDAIFDALRKEPRFVALLKRLKFTQ